MLSHLLYEELYKIWVLRDPLQSDRAELELGLTDLLTEDNISNYVSNVVLNEQGQPQSFDMFIKTSYRQAGLPWSKCNLSHQLTRNFFATLSKSSSKQRAVTIQHDGYVSCVMLDGSGPRDDNVQLKIELQELIRAQNIDTNIEYDITWIPVRLENSKCEAKCVMTRPEDSEEF